MNHSRRSASCINIPSQLSVDCQQVTSSVLSSSLTILPFLPLLTHLTKKLLLVLSNLSIIRISFRLQVDEMEFWGCIFFCFQFKDTT